MNAIHKVRDVFWGSKKQSMLSQKIKAQTENMNNAKKTSKPLNMIVVMFHRFKTSPSHHFPYDLFPHISYHHQDNKSYLV